MRSSSAAIRSGFAVRLGQRFEPDVVAGEGGNSSAWGTLEPSCRTDL